MDFKKKTSHMTTTTTFEISDAQMSKMREQMEQTREQMNEEMRESLTDEQLKHLEESGSDFLEDEYVETFEEANRETTGEFISTPDATYSREGSEKWMKSDLPNAGASPWGSSPDELLDYLTGSSDLEVVGREEIRGVPTEHVQTSVDPSEFGDEESLGKPAALLMGMNPFPVDVWIDDEGLIRRMALMVSMDMSSQTSDEDMDFGGFDLEMTMDFFDYGVDVDVQAPDPSEVTDSPVGYDSFKQSGSGSIRYEVGEEDAAAGVKVESSKP